MKVLLKTTVYDRIVKDLEQAKRDDRAIDCIVVTYDEYAELRGDRRVSNVLCPSDAHRAVAAYASPAQEAALVCRGFPLADHRIHGGRPMSYRAIASETFCGVPLFVVPEGYCPA